MDKRVDESWKDEVAKERGGGPAQPTEPASPQPESARQEMPQVDFGFFLSTLSMQALVALGEIPNPATNQPEANLDQARYLIDLLGLLQEKTKGNLTSEEAQALEGLLYELRMKYVAKTKEASA